MISEDAAPSLVRSVSERRSAGSPFPLYRLDSWEEAFDGVAAGITAAAADSDFFAARQSAWVFIERVEGLAGQLGFGAAAWARQVHGVEVCIADGASYGVVSPGEADGLVARRADLLLLVTVADCVPVYLLEPSRGVIGLLHAGWRGAAGGILEQGLAALRATYDAEAGDLYLHLGPSICGECYEVGPEVLRRFGRQETEAAGVDLRAELVRQATSLGVRPERMSTSAWCTRCDLDRFHSHRGSGESAGRMAAFLGWNEALESGLKAAKSR